MDAVKYQTSRIGRLFFVRWQQTDIPSLEEVEKEVAAARKASSGPLIYISISNDKTTPPDDATRKKLLSGVDVILKMCDQFFIVLESKGFKASVQRTAMAGLMLLHKESKSIKIRSSLDEVFGELEKSQPLDRAAITRQLKASGMIETA